MEYEPHETFQGARTGQPAVIIYAKQAAPSEYDLMLAAMTHANSLSMNRTICHLRYMPCPHDIYLR